MKIRFSSHQSAAVTICNTCFHSRHARLMDSMKLALLIVLISIAEFSSCDTCKLNLDKNKESKLTPFQRKIVKGLSVDVTYDCNEFECHQIKDEEVDIQATNKTGCRCSRDGNVYDCRCCFKIKRWSFLICVAAAVEVVDPYKFSIFATFEGNIFARLSVPLKALAQKYIPVCIPCVLPPPLEWLSPCFKFKFEVPSPKNNNIWRICGKIKIGIYLVPIFNIYTKCFEIPNKINEMKIEGQKNVDENVEVPAAVKVKDPENMLPVVCESNKKKEKAIACKSGRGGDECTKPVVINVDEKINWEELKAEQSPFLVRLYIDNPLIPVQEYAEFQQYPFFQELVAEAQSEQWMDKGTEIIYPGASCGGVVLTADMLLTNCACVRSFYAAHKLKQEIDVEEDHLFDVRSNEIHLKFIDASLTGYMLDSDDGKMIADSACAKAILNGEPNEILQTSIIMMPFTPSIPLGAKDMFIDWPPNVLQPNEVMNLVSYGLQPINPAWVFKNAAGAKVNFEDTAVNVFFKKCTEETSYCRDGIAMDKQLDQGIKDRISCVCSANPGSQLGGGELGYPLIAGRKLFGLNCLPVNNGTLGSTGVAIFDNPTIREIEDFVGKSNLHTTTAGPPSGSTIPFMSGILSYIPLSFLNIY